jgi:hypothetical protein
MSDLSDSIRSEGDIAARPGQMDRLHAIADQVDDLRTQLAAAHAVIRRLLDWWHPEAEPDGATFNWWYLESGIGDTDEGGSEPMTLAEQAVIRAALDTEVQP